MTTSLTVPELATEIASAEKLIASELRRLSDLAAFRELRLDVTVTTDRRLNGVELVASIDVRIRASL